MSVALLPGMDVAAADGEPVSVQREAPNRWLLTVGAAAFSANVELDLCGAWLTLARGAAPRPLVVRRAGWVDLRGHPPGVALDDRVGLGPEDSLVVFSAPGGGADTVDEQLLDRWLAVAGRPADVQLASHAGASVPRPVLVVRVPPTDGEPMERVVAATGIPAGALELPGYPLGDSQPDLWKVPPAAPRLARLLVRPDVANVATVRALLRRLVASWRLEDRVAGDDVLLLATELTANAVEHARTDCYASITYLGDRLRLDVDDASPALPTLRQVTDADTTGRGLHLVDALASSWGVVVTARGKRAWAEVPVSTA